MYTMLPFLFLFLIDTTSGNIIPNPVLDASTIICSSPTQCTINCFNKQCRDKTLICPTAKPCTIKCHSKHSCLNATIIANLSSHLTLHTSSSHAASNSNIYCPLLPSSLCQIYGDSTSDHQWHHINLHINSNTHYQFMCNSSLCSDDGSISLFFHQNDAQNVCKLSNITYECIEKQLYNRQLLGAISTTSPNISTSAQYSSINAYHNPFGIRLTTAQLSWLLFVIALLLIVLFCVLICLLLCIWRQRKQSNDKKLMKNSHNLADNMSLKYLVLGYQDGRKIKIPFDISTLEGLNNNGRRDTNCISESLHAALSDEHNKIISAAILDAHHEESHDEATENTAVPSLNFDDHSIDIVMEDIDIMDGSAALSSANINATLIKVGSCPKQRIVQNSMSLTLTNSIQMDLVNGLKKYKTRKDSDAKKESDASNTSNTEASHTSDISIDMERRNDDKRILHVQSSSQPQILVSKRKSSPERPKTAHKSPKHDTNKFEWRTPTTEQLLEHDAKSTQSESDESESLVEANDTSRLRVSELLLQNEEIPSMQLSASAPNINKKRFKKQNMRVPFKSMSPSKRGIRSPSPLPKPRKRSTAEYSENADDIHAQVNARALTQPHILSKKTSMRQQMTMHHQRHQRVLRTPVQRRGNGQRIVGRRRNHRHMSEPSNAYKCRVDGAFAAVNIAPLQLNDEHTDHSMRTRSSNSRLRSRSHPTSPHRISGKVWNNESAGFVMNDDAYDMANMEKTVSKHNKHNERSRYTKATNNTNELNPFSRCTDFETKGETTNTNITGNRLQIPIYSKSGKKIKHKYYEDKRRILEADHSGYTETTISDTPIPDDINPITLRPINVQYKTTTISSAFIPPPPSPQLTKSKHYTLSPPNSLKTLDSNTLPIDQQRNSNNTISGTTTFDEHNDDEENSESTLTQDTANSNANRVRGSNQSDKTVTYKTDETDPPPFEIHLQEPIDAQNSRNSESSENDRDSNHTDTQSDHSDSDSGRRFSKHYIVSSADSDKMMFIPPVPMHSTDDSKEIPIRNPYALRQLKPLPDAASISTISPEWKTQNEYYTKLNRLKKYTEEDEDDDESHNDEEKAAKPTYGSGNPYLLEPQMPQKNSNDSSNISNRQSSSTHPPTFPNRASSSTHPPTFPSIHSSPNNNGYGKEYYFAHQLTETIKTLTISQSANQSDNEFIETDNFRKAVDNDHIWHSHRELNNDYAE